ncbi:MAG: M48 family metallopeptidase [Bacteroidaceae bacterium]|nr:M48 family metallopeptidase [Bacteroidaceae bacterium]
MTNFLIDLKSSEYEHNLDKRVLEKLNGMLGFQNAVNAFVNWTYVKWQMIGLKGGHFQVTEESCPEVYKIVEDVQKVLGVSHLPNIYTKWEYAINAYTTGLNDDSLMVLNTGAIDLLTDEELKFVVGHEFGHIKSKHVVFHTMAEMFDVAMSMLPVIGNLAEPAKYWLLYWQRMSEFTADRAGLLACQNIDVALNAIIKMAGLPLKMFGQNMRDSFLKQAKSFSIDLTSLSDKAIKTVCIATSTHPWTVMRAAELIKWYESGEYQTLLDKHTGVPCIWSDCAKIISKNAEFCPHCGRPQTI